MDSKLRTLLRDATPMEQHLLLRRAGIETPMQIALQWCRYPQPVGFVACWHQGSRSCGCYNIYEAGGARGCRQYTPVRHKFHLHGLFGYDGRWGDRTDAKTIDGINFVLLPPRKGLHRFKLACPICDKLFTPPGFIQHSPVHQGAF